ncbi:MAG: sigma-70 family RNA polymerase sigma factor [Bacteroidales bacterium]|nr:sigma-70 family RNA polymerase sigma factor [Bacteroidales bacterium]
MTRQEATVFYRTHSRVVYNTALRILGNEADAAEVMQDTLLKYLSGGVRSGSEAQAAAWLRTTCIRKSIDRLRSNNKYPAFVNADDLMDVPEEESMDLPSIEQVHLAMKSLPEPYSLVLNLVLIEGLSYKQITDITGQKETTLRSIYARGRQKLMKTLTNHE